MEAEINNNSDTIQDVSNTSGENDLFNRMGKKSLWYLSGIILLIIFYVYHKFIFLEQVLLYTDIGSDSVNIYFPWLIHSSEYLKNENSMGWSFSQGLGQNLFPFSLGDVFSILLVYCNKNNIPYGIAFMELAKILLSGLFFFRFLKEHKLSDFTTLIFSLAFAFSGYIILGGCWTVFSLEALYAAVLLYGFERWLNHGKIFWMVTGVLLMTLLQPFFMYLYSVFFLFYGCVRYADVKGEWNKSFGLFFLKTAGLFALGVALSSFQLFADILQYMESPRVGGDSSLFSRLLKHPALSTVDADLFSTTVLRSFSADILGTGINYNGSMNYMEAPLFYCGVFSLVILPHFYFTLSKKQKFYYGIFAFVFFTPILFPFFRYAFWAFTGDYYRTYSLLITLLIILFSAKAFDYVISAGHANKKALLSTVVFLFFPFSNLYLKVDSSLRLKISLLILIYARLIYGFKSGGKNFFLLKAMVLILFVAELATFADITINIRDAIKNSDLKSKKGYNDFSMDALGYIKKQDTGFYRVHKDYSSGTAIHKSINDAQVQGYYGVNSYNSFNQKNYIKFLGDLNVIDPKDETSTRWAEGLGDRPVLFSLVSGKYFLSKKNTPTVSDKWFEFVGDFGNVKLYENKYSLPFGFTYSNIISHSDFVQLPAAEKDIAILNACVIEATDFDRFRQLNQVSSFHYRDSLIPSLIDTLKCETFRISSFSLNRIAGKIMTSGQKILFFSIPFDEGWRATLNGQETELYRLNCGLTGLMLPKGLSDIVLKFEPRMKKIGLVISLIFFFIFLIFLYWNKAAVFGFLYSKSSG